MERIVLSAQDRIVLPAKTFVTHDLGQETNLPHLAVQVTNPMHKSARLSISNIPASLKAKRLRKMCTDIGTIQNFQMFMRDGTLMAEVTYAQQEAADRFYQAYNRKMVDLSHLIIRYLL
ncbi:unnamed protein product [Darwinula stevensoni]|uniref:RRM domain-containing protein n=1 Tax=Darwinula stevensoni TaxID=69355 RepID=A0A7R9FTV5_9CRUS|nr:unnamed protein product [Darwinula stevensoni]CAG0907026.1 unnamed protein product [Darwinula stevensoni]